ncbi:hypothetical protein [Deinococcus humi]|uniref:Uncharacterized protein n=1 Tax=Deinococcus humi TaxID=662880 RepID=A0A7W8JV57_9DEIO|nr:hypothetical protein [Deinococcus humi]MBB5363786.1 hypothetical protein [Deinococcus humi]GGO32012.1 hypothetical protein GCM10008949_28860 [Deinococcus humi]
MSRRNWLIWALMAALQTGAQAGGGEGLLDPLALLRQDSRVTRVEVLATHATVQRWRVLWNDAAAQMDVMFSNEAVTAAQAQTVRRITVALQVPADRDLTLPQVRALDQVTRKLAVACLGQEVPVLTDVLRGRLGRPLPSPGPLLHFPTGLQIDVEQGDAGALSGPWLQVTVPLGQHLARCQMTVS